MNTHDYDSIDNIPCLKSLKTEGSMNTARGGNDKCYRCLGGCDLKSIRVLPAGDYKARCIFARFDTNSPSDYRLLFEITEGQHAGIVFPTDTHAVRVPALAKLTGLSHLLGHALPARPVSIRLVVQNAGTPQAYNALTNAWPTSESRPPEPDTHKDWPEDFLKLNAETYEYFKHGAAKGQRARCLYLAAADVARSGAAHNQDARRMLWNVGIRTGLAPKTVEHAITEGYRQGGSRNG